MASFREIRQEAGISLRDAAQQIGVNHSTLARWELHDAEPSDFSDLERLVKFYLQTTQERARAVESLARAKGLAGSGA